ncbi:urea ABC transporter permease subunit UrtB [Ruegeria marina]|uniref:Amino acid/amide ABC transporter membrane protein 1, HAAT family n=1 Tax=Ruegeria marina TaxID=639004 RepID=A0A1G6Z235_9RHOB|nr:urea ABC transporter permease subunit UrtB [Ruegeria marina]SDD95997.1 amino acid/amide ABC transporter membrane protein 1, HAAT family [Ruegeria marina]
MTRLMIALTALFLLCTQAMAQDATVQSVLQAHRETIEKGSRKSIGAAIDAIAASGLPQAQDVLQVWAAKEMWQRGGDGLFFRGVEKTGRQVELFDFDSGQSVGMLDRDDLEQIKPNSGVRALIGTALVQFQLSDPDPIRRAEALDAIQRSPAAELLAPLRASIPAEPDPALKDRKMRVERLLTMAYDPDDQARITAIEDMSGDLGVDMRATLNPLLVTRIVLAEGLPATANIRREVKPGDPALGLAAAYDMLIAAGLAQPIPDAEARKALLIEHAADGLVAGIPLHQLDTQAARDAAYVQLAQAGLVPRWSTAEAPEVVVTRHRFVEVYNEPSAAVTEAAEQALDEIEMRVGLNQAFDLGLDALSLASIYFLAAIGLAITFGVMGVINMAHGEFIMMGAYTGYMVQQVIADHTLSILVAIPLAFAVTFAAGVAMERLVIRHLYNRPLETLLATFGISIAMQQLAKNIFGTQARPLTAPGWLDGAWVLNDVVSISYIRIAIFVLALIFLGLFLFIMRRTRLGLETRAVTQNPRMAASMGINPDRINMLTFGLGSGIAGIAGVAIGLFAKVTSELGSDYIVQSFMTVVVGGVGNIWGTLAGAAMIGTLQKGIEWLNPSNTLAAQTYMIIFIIIFIQFRPRGIIALRGRAAGD